MSTVGASVAAPRLHLWALTLGAMTLAGAWAGPLPTLAPSSFAAHMGMHVLVVAVAAPLLALAVTGSRWDPAARRPALFAPLPAAVLELVVIWGWHTPLLHQAARSAPAALALEQGSFLAVGLLVWLSCFGGERRRSGRSAAGIVGLLLTSMHMTLLGALLTLAPRPLYPHAPAGPAGLTALDDLHLGGMLMLLGGGSAYLLGALYLLSGLLRDAEGGSAP